MDPLMAGSLALEAVILGGGAGLAALILTGQRSLLAEIAAVETRLGKRIDAVHGEMKEVEPLGEADRPLDGTGHRARLPPFAPGGGPLGRSRAVPSDAAPGADPGRIPRLTTVASGFRLGVRGRAGRRP